MVSSLSIYLGFLCAPPFFFLGPLLEDSEPAAFVVILVAIVLTCELRAKDNYIYPLLLVLLPRFSSVLIISIIW